MKVKVIKQLRSGGKYGVEIIQGTQGFRLDYSGSKLECRWMARMFRIALKNHDKEVANTKIKIEGSGSATVRHMGAKRIRLGPTAGDKCHDCGHLAASHSPGLGCGACDAAGSTCRCPVFVPWRRA